MQINPGLTTHHLLPPDIEHTDIYISPLNLYSLNQIYNIKIKITLLYIKTLNFEILFCTFRSPFSNFNKITRFTSFRHIACLSLKDNYSRLILKNKLIVLLLLCWSVFFLFYYIIILCHYNKYHFSVFCGKYNLVRKHNLV